MDIIAKKKNNGIRISFEDSMSSEDVTGSCVLVTTPNHKILFDCGMSQSNDRYEDFLVNNRKFKGFKPKEIDLTFVSHNHIDHVGLVPKLYAQGCQGNVIISQGSGQVMKDMCLDSAQICERDVLFINEQKGKSYVPYYTEADVHTMLNKTYEYDVNVVHKIDEELSFKLVPSGHLLGGVQILLYITVGGNTKKILFTGDLGNKVVDNKFVGKYEQITEFVDVVIAESTYGDRSDLKVGNKERKNDIEKLKTIINTQIKEMGGRVILPSFAQSRSQQLAWLIYSIYKDEEWKPKVYIDSPLTMKVWEDYSKSLDGEDKEIFDELTESGFINFVKETEASKALVQSDEPCLCISTAGFCTIGRIRHHIKKVIGDSNSTILFAGYSSPGSLASMIKDPKNKTIMIDQKEYACRASVFNLKSMSGHAPYSQLIEDYSEMNALKIILHHGSKEAKESLKKGLEKELEKKCKTTRVVVANSGLKFSL